MADVKDIEGIDLEKFAGKDVLVVTLPKSTSPEKVENFKKVIEKEFDKDIAVIFVSEKVKVSKLKVIEANK